MSTKIPYCDETLNVTAGCTKCSPGCENCYAERFAYRLACMGQEKYQKVVKGLPTSKPFWKKGFKAAWTDDIYCDESVLDKPLHWKKPRRIFINSMSDLFHPKVPFEFIDKVFNMMRITPDHTHLVLTKRIKRLSSFIYQAYGKNTILSNVHLGISISTQDEMWKAKVLVDIPAAVHFISFEPMLEGIEIPKEYLGKEIETYFGKAREKELTAEKFISGDYPDDFIDWVIVGGESGPGARPMHPDWPRSIRDQCVDAGVPFFFKQWGKWGIAESIPNDLQKRFRVVGGSEPLSPNTIFKIFPEHEISTIPMTGWVKVGKKKAGCVLDGREWKQYPQK